MKYTPNTNWHRPVEYREITDEEETSQTNIVEPSRNSSSCSASQVGGTHYTRLAIQPWEYIFQNGLGYFEGSAIKYLSRWRNKGGIEDLRKARHFIEQLIEFEELNQK